MEKIEQMSRDAWLDKSLVVLACDGHSALRAEPLASRFGVSRGSFYWHFKNLKDFHLALLERWELVAVDFPYDAAAKGAKDDAAQTLRKLVRGVFLAPTELERAVHSWADVSPLAMAQVKQVNQKRIDLLTGLYKGVGFTTAHAQTRAKLLYWTYLGHVLAPEVKVTAPLMRDLNVLLPD